MARKAQTVWVSDFKGQHDGAVPATSPVVTSSLSNVKARFGRITGRGGMTKYQSIAVAAGNPPVLGLFNYKRVSGTHELLRMTLTKLEKLISGVWTDVTGTAFSHSSTMRPQWDVIDDILVMTNEGIQRPRKYTGSGNSADIASSTMPFCKAIKAYKGFLFAINISEDATFTDIFEGYRIGRYSDDWENDWSLCAGNEITLDETPGSWVAAELLGRHMMGIKTDGVVAVTHVGGESRFTQELISKIGTISPLSVRRTQEREIYLLGTDAIIYRITQSGMVPVTELQLSNTLPPKVSLGRFKFARSLVDEEESTYYLFYDRTGLTGQFLDSYVACNYRSGEIVSGELEQQVIAAESFKTTENSAESLLVSTNTLVEEFDSGKDDDGVAITRSWTSGWQNLQQEGWLHGIRLVLKKEKAGRVKIAIATNFEEQFLHERTVDLQGLAVSDAFVEAHLRITPPVFASWANVRVRFYHDSATAKTELAKIGFEMLPVLQTAESPAREGEASVT